MGACGKTRVVAQNRRPRPGTTRNGMLANPARFALLRDWFVHGSPTVRPRTGRRRPQIGADAVSPLTTSAFNLPHRLAAKADPYLIADDEKHFAAIAESLD